MHQLLISLASAGDCTPLDLDAQVDLAVTAVTDDELGEASRLAQEGLDNLVCQERVVDPEDIASLHQVQGAVGVYSNQPRLADEALQQAKAVYPAWFNDRLGGSVKTVWDHQPTSGEATLTAWPIPDEGVLYVDGLARAEQPVALSPGRHLVQVAVGAEVAYVDLVDLADGQLIELATGLPEPTHSRRVSPWLIATASSAAVAGGLYGGALYADRAMLEEANVQDREPKLAVMDEYRGLSVALWSGAVVAGAATAASLGLLTREQVRKRQQD